MIEEELKNNPSSIDEVKMRGPHQDTVSYCLTKCELIHGRIDPGREYFFKRGYGVARIRSVQVV
jgi:hypothetical protein